MRELRMLFEQDSLFFDSPLSEVGIEQAWDLFKFVSSQPVTDMTSVASRPIADLKVHEVVALMRGDIGQSAVVTSNLRRAISTGVLGMSSRFLKTEETDQLTIMTSLQEISRNVDTLSLTPAGEIPETPTAEARLRNVGDLLTHFYRTRLEGRTYNDGNKKLNQKAIDRHRDFTKWIFDQNKAETVVVVGHSLWFREFFKSYLPKTALHIAKDKKIGNCGVVAFDLYRYCDPAEPKKEAVVRIRPESIKEIYVGFEGKSAVKTKARPAGLDSARSSSDRSKSR